MNSSSKSSLIGDRVKKAPLHERIDNRRKSFLHSLYIDNLNTAIQNCKSDVMKVTKEVQLQRDMLRITKSKWGQFLKDEVHNTQEFDQVMNKFDHDMALKGAAIIEMENSNKLQALNLDFAKKELDLVRGSRKFLEEIAETQKMTIEQVMNQPPQKVIKFLQEFEGWQIRKLETIEEQDTLNQKLNKEFKSNEQLSLKKIDKLKSKKKAIDEHVRKVEKATVEKQNVCETFEQYMKEDNTAVTEQLEQIKNKLITVNERTQNIGWRTLSNKSHPALHNLTEKSLIELLKDIERRTFYLLDLVDCLPKEPVGTKFYEVQRRKLIEESRQLYANQEKLRLDKLEKLKERANLPIPVRVGKPLKPMTMLKTYGKWEEMKKEKKREFQRTFFNDASSPTMNHQDYF